VDPQSRIRKGIGVANFPKHIILANKIYVLSFSNRITSGRAFNRELIDFIVDLQNPAESKDRATTYVGASRELFDDFPSFKVSVPFEWVLGRFLAYHVRSNALEQISGPEGQVLKTTTFQSYLGRLDISDTEVDKMLIELLSTWIRVFPAKSVLFSDLYVSTKIHVSKIQRGVNALQFMGCLEELSTSVFRLLPKVLETAGHFSSRYSSKEPIIKELDRMPSIFLSHNTKDKFFVRELADRLSRMGVKVWIDEAEIKVGDSLTEKIGKAIEETDFVGVVLSKNSINSQWVQKELQIALQEEFRKRKVVVLPLLLEPVDIPPFLKDKLYADFTTPEKFKLSFPKLLEALSVPQEKLKSIIEEPKIEVPEATVSRADKELSDFVDLRILDLDLERSYKPEESKLLYNMYLKLSARPSEDWIQIFNAERRFPRHTKWRDARVEKDFIVILCVPEELEKVHLNDLKEDVLNANTKYRQYLFERAQMEIKEKDREKTEADKLQNLRKRLDFS
jgi:hypothetical protein